MRFRQIERQMWFRVKEHFSVEISPSLPSSLPSPGESDARPSLTDLPDEVLLAVFMLLTPKDLIRFIFCKSLDLTLLKTKKYFSLESSCRRLRSVLVYYNTYKHRLDRILR